MNSFIILAACLVALIGTASSTDYCASDVCLYWQGTHIACGHNGQFARSCPRDAALVTITPELKNFIVDWHNQKRNTVGSGAAPNHRSACRMATMEWDDELAKLAELNVKQCDMKHDICHNTATIKPAGQNLAFDSFNGVPDYKYLLDKSFTGWYDEIKASNTKLVNKFPENYNGPVVLHFTGMMLEGNNRIGCAAATYTSPGKSYKTILVACNMKGLTIPTTPVYSTCQTAGSKCKSGRNPNYPGLCNTSENYE